MKRQYEILIQNSLEIENLLFENQKEWGLNLGYVKTVKQAVKNIEWELVASLIDEAMIKKESDDAFMGHLQFILKRDVLTFFGSAFHKYFVELGSNFDRRTGAEMFINLLHDEEGEMQGVPDLYHAIEDELNKLKGGG